MALYLTTVARAKRKREWQGVSDNVASDFLVAAQDWIEGYCDRKFQSATYSAIYNGDGRGQP